MMSTSTYFMTACVDWVLPIIYDSDEHYGMHYCFWSVQAICVFSLICGFMVIYLDKDAEDLDEGEDLFSFSAITGFPAGYWLLTFCESMIALGVTLLVRTGSDYFQKRYGLDREQAGFIIGIPQILLCCTTFLAGILVYRIGHKTHFSTTY